MLNIIRADEPIKVSTITILLYGQPSSGKTSISFTSSKPLLLDFDKGGYRSQNRGDIVEINSWIEVAKLNSSDIENYSTIVIDTVGRAMDFLADYLVEGNAKLATRDGALTLQGYGALKGSFISWVKQLKMLGKDIIFIAHDKENSDNDYRYFRPDIIGGSYSEIMKLADFVGYMYFNNSDRMLDFNPCEKWIGKNTAQLRPERIPNFANNPEYLATVISKMKNSLGDISKAQMEALLILNSHKEKINSLVSAEMVNEYLSEVQTATPSLPRGIVEQIRRLFKMRTIELNLIFDEASKQYTPPKE